MLNILFLFLVGILGILVSNLIEIDKLNQQNDGTTNLKKYWQKNWANMALSFCMVTASIIGKQYVSELAAVGKSLFLGVFCIGIAGQYVAEFVRSKTKQFLQQKTSLPPNTTT